MSRKTAPTLLCMSAASDVETGSYSGKTESCSDQCYRWKYRHSRVRTSPQRRCLDIRFRLDVSCASLLLQHDALCLHLSLANFNDLVAKCSSDLFKSLVSCLPADGVNRRSETVALSDIVCTCLMEEGLGLGSGLTYGK
jgi:hypothetical protein